MQRTLSLPKNFHCPAEIKRIINESTTRRMKRALLWHINFHAIDSNHSRISPRHIINATRSPTPEQSNEDSRAFPSRKVASNYRPTVGWVSPRIALERISKRGKVSNKMPPRISLPHS